MGVEIERKFRVNKKLLPELQGGEIIRQGYVAMQNRTVVRVRTKGEKAFLTIKGEGRNAITRPEWEYPVPVEDALAMQDELCQNLISKTRYHIKMGQHVWELDIFDGANEGLEVAEIELTSEDEAFEKPEWLGKEVSGLGRYFNSSLLNYPFSKWSSDEQQDLDA